MKDAEIKDKAGKSHMVETYEWNSQKFSEQRAKFYKYFGRIDYISPNIQRPLLSKKIVTRSGARYTTDFSNFDTNGKPQSILETGPTGDTRSTSLTYYSNTSKRIYGRVKDVTVHSTPERKVSRTFDDNGNLSSLTENGATTKYSYYSNGNLMNSHNALGQWSHYYWYHRGVPRFEYQQEGNVAGAGYWRPHWYAVNDDGYVTSYLNAEYQRTSYDRDSLGRVTSIKYPQGTTATISYHPNSIRYTRGQQEVVTGLDLFGRTASYINNGIQTIYTYDALGRKIFESLPGSTLGTTYHYDVLNRMTSTAYSDGQLARYEYDGVETSVYDERNKKTTYSYRSYGKPGEAYLMQIDAPISAASVTISRDSRNRIDAVIQDGLRRSYSYDIRDNLASVTEPERPTMYLSYDVLGNLKHKYLWNTETSSWRHIADYSYDRRNQLKNINYIDPNTPDSTFFYDKRDNVKQITQGGIQRTYTYHPNGQLRTENLIVDGLDFAMRYDYNALDQLSSFTYPDGQKIDYSPDALGRPTKVGSLATQISYHPNNAIANMRYANGVEVIQDLNDRQRLLNKKVKRYGQYYYDVSTHYDQVGNVRRISDWKESPYHQWLYYDDMNRLRYHSGPWGWWRFAYDGRGNITYKRIDRYESLGGSHTLNYNYDYSSNLLQSTSGSVQYSFEYDEWGNVTHNGKDQFTYDDAQNMVCQNCTASNSAHYLYDTNNLRVRRVKDGLNTYYVYASGGNLIMEYTPGEGRYEKHGYLGSKQISTTTVTQANLDLDGDGQADASEIGQYPSSVATTNKQLFINTDVLGSPIVGTESNGSVRWIQRYYPYGERRNKSVVNDGKNHEQWFGGKPEDGDTGLSYFGARSYDPVLGRFMGIDPVSPNPEGNIHSLNRYAYANNNPYRYVDPDGRLAVMAVVAIVTIAYSAYEGSQDGGGASGALAEASGYNGAVASYNEFQNGNYGAAVLGVGSIVCKVCKVAKKGGTYVLKDADGVIQRTGRSKDLHKRELDHARDPQTKDLQFEIDRRTDDYSAQRGREQIIYDQNPQAKAVNGGLNHKRAVSPRNPKREIYRRAGEKL